MGLTMQQPIRKSTKIARKVMFRLKRAKSMCMRYLETYKVDEAKSHTSLQIKKMY